MFFHALPIFIYNSMDLLKDVVDKFVLNTIIPAVPCEFIDRIKFSGH